MKESKLVLTFFDIEQLPETEGLKFALFRIERKGNMIGFDWGYANYENGIFEKLDQGDVTGSVVKWCELPRPEVLL